ncbi:hypothetical protein FQN53_004752 [Emmonsiellopsis sp. PD_33]|nr:hypothetical protein FQN53_004752 [Emmonsiellopsis sp. PD_33]
MSEEVRYVAAFLRTKLPTMLVRFGATVTMIQGIGLLSVWAVCSAWLRLVTRYEGGVLFIIPALFAQLNQSTIHGNMQISKGRVGISRLESHLAAKTGIDRGHAIWIEDATALVHNIDTGIDP